MTLDASARQYFADAAASSMCSIFRLVFAMLLASSSRPAVILYEWGAYTWMIALGAGEYRLIILSVPQDRA